MNGTPDLDARIAALAERRASTAPPAPSPAPSKRKRRHAAPAARILSGGLSASALIALVAAIGAGDVAKEAAASGPAMRPVATKVATPTTVVVRERHYVQYVDRDGRPIAPPAMPPAAAATAPVPEQQNQPVPARPAAGASPPNVPAFAPVPSPVSVPAANPGSAPDATRVPGNKTTTPPATTPVTTPPVTSTPTTLAPPPPPCSGSKC
jgi:hypothetical protein